MMTPIAFIDAKGGPAKIARDLEPFARSDDDKIKPGAIALWRHRNKIPRAAWPELQRAYPEVTLENLLEVEAAGDAAAAGDGEGERGAA